MSETKRYIVIANPRFTKRPGAYTEDNIDRLYCDMYYIPEEVIHEQQLKFMQQTEGLDQEKLWNAPGFQTEFQTGLLGYSPELLLSNTSENYTECAKEMEQYRNKLPDKPFTIVSCHYFIY